MAEENKEPVVGENKKQKLTTNQKIMIGGFAVVIIAIIAVGIFVVMNNRKEKEKPKGNLVVDESNLDDIQAQLDEAVKDGMYRVRMNRDWEFEDGSSPSKNAYVANSETNTKDVYIDVTLNGTEEVVYKSTIIPVGSALKEIVLDKPLPKGNYEGVCTYHLLDEDQNELSSVSLVVTLNILN